MLMFEYSNHKFLCAREFGDHLWTELQKVLKIEGHSAMATVEQK